MLTDRQRQVIDLRDREGLSFGKIAKRLGCDKSNIFRAYKAGRKKLDEKAARLDPGVHGVLDRLGMGDLSGQHTGWVHREDPDTGEWASVYYYLGPDGAPSEASLEDMLTGALGAVFRGDLATPARPPRAAGNLLVVDIADLHIGKLCIRSETGFSYDRAEAIRRGIEGTRALVDKARAHGVAHVLFVIGNDVMHIDRPDRRTTSGTPQDTDGTQAVMFDDAFAFYVACIDILRSVAPVSLIYCPSNHDWFSGFALARSLRAYYRDCPEVIATEYATSHRHRKYFRFEANLIGVTHHDGAKEKDLSDLMSLEARGHLDASRHRYWYLHHLHHKDRKKGRPSERRTVEKDHIGFTVIRDSAGLSDTAAAEIEVVRSPSPPDGWHDRNGYVSRQGVECFLHDPHAGQFARFTEWF